MTAKIRSGLAALLVVLVTACSGADPHKGEHCVRSHVDTYTTMICGAFGKYGCMVWVPIVHHDTVCDQWAPDNPATVKPAEPTR